MFSFKQRHLYTSRLISTQMNNLNFLIICSKFFVQFKCLTSMRQLSIESKCLSFFLLMSNKFVGVKILDEIESFSFQHDA